MTATIMLFNPTAPREADPSAARHAPSGLAGKVVGFIDNTKPNFQLLAADLGELLMAQHGVTRVVSHQKRNASVAASDDVIASFAGQCDVVIAGSGD